MSVLARAADFLIPAPAPAPPRVERDPADAVLWARLQVAASLRDVDAFQRVMADMLARPWVGQQIAAAVVVHAGHQHAGVVR